MDFTKLASLAKSVDVDARIVHTAVELHVFDALTDSASNCRSGGLETLAEPRATELLLNALAALELVEKRGDRFSLAPVSRQYLVRSSPHYLEGMILFDASLWKSWEKLPDAIRSRKAGPRTGMISRIRRKPKFSSMGSIRS